MRDEQQVEPELDQPHRRRRHLQARDGGDPDELVEPDQPEQDHRAADRCNETAAACVDIRGCTVIRHLHLLYI